jgi:PHD/YefM family antitoxin component YafN of YafNO toxin-antitoxin module
MGAKQMTREDSRCICFGSYVVDDHGKTTAVVVPLKQYRRLKEDLHDLALVAERRDAPSMTLGELKRRLKKNGIV